MKSPIFRELVDWDYNFKNEFNNREKKCTFVIDAWGGAPILSLYKYTRFGINCSSLEKQPPLAMLETAIKEQEKSADKMYKINQEIREWIEENNLIVD
ncbi:DVU0772 family protein [Desulfotomaculum sp. 1211_IL3151]|uniref:DVU0772 family protein n=1 Tax=Desulfotomaculum sp. 1211_IL3151 TaxID=3084055 RepID=UPI002FD94002